MDPVEALVSGKKMKVYFVEIDDDNREKVISGVTNKVTIDMRTDFDDLYVDYSHLPVAKYMTTTEAMVTIRLVADDDGTLLRVENFMEEE